MACNDDNFLTNWLEKRHGTKKVIQFNSRSKKLFKLKNTDVKKKKNLAA